MQRQETNTKFKGKRHLMKDIRNAKAGDNGKNKRKKRKQKTETKGKNESKEER
jgi:hypothetical protein